MIGFATLGTNDLEKAANFYDQLLSPLGAKRALELERLITWSAGEGTPMVGVITPFDKESASCGNGNMIALAAKDRAHVDAMHAKALELGATDEGAPGERMPGFYAAYFRDLDGHKLNFFYMGA